MRYSRESPCWQSWMQREKYRLQKVKTFCCGRKIYGAYHFIYMDILPGKNRKVMRVRFKVRESFSEWRNHNEYSSSTWKRSVWSRRGRAVLSTSQTRDGNEYVIDEPIRTVYLANRFCFRQIPQYYYVRATTVMKKVYWLLVKAIMLWKCLSSSQPDS